ncbi:hypothetical protein VDG1235_3916 [Verrucomicrobiia bacterium DG1235]|nr:hypothetical protein VDG1235_3916 [Verrucomicrobiae bacterium DG1235]
METISYSLSSYIRSNKHILRQIRTRRIPGGCLNRNLSCPFVRKAPSGFGDAQQRWAQPNPL